MTCSRCGSHIVTVENGRILCWSCGLIEPRRGTSTDGYYRPGRILALLERWHSHLMCGKVPLLKPQEVGGRVVWEEVNPAELPRTTRGENLNDGLDASRIMADLRSAMRPQPLRHPGPWAHLLLNESEYMFWRYIETYFKNFDENKIFRIACRKAQIHPSESGRVCYTCVVKMAVNLGWTDPRVAEVRSGSV